MKRALFALLLLTACSPKGEDLLIQDHQGRPAARVVLRSGAKNGTVILFRPDGKIRLEGEYVDDRRTGWWKSFHPNGSTRSITPYLEGAKEGPRIHWDSAGRPTRAEYFSKGMPHGHFYRFFPDGTLAQHSIYMNGVLHGRHDQWYAHEGGVRVKGCYEHGAETGLWTAWNSNGRMIWQAYLKDGELSRAVHGEWRRY